MGWFGGKSGNSEVSSERGGASLTSSTVNGKTQESTTSSVQKENKSNSRSGSSYQAPPPPSSTVVSTRIISSSNNNNKSTTTSTTSTTSTNPTGSARKSSSRTDSQQQQQQQQQQTAATSEKQPATLNNNQDIDNRSTFDDSLKNNKNNNMKHEETDDDNSQVKSFSYDQHTEDESNTMTREQPVVGLHQMNSLFNGHLMKWKYEAEEGTLFIRFPAFMGGLAQITVAICAFVLDRPRSIETYSIVMYACVILMSLMILILDGRFLSNHPLSIRSHFRNIATRNFNILRFLWGRGILYMSAGVLTIAQMWMPAILVGSFTCFIAILALIVGVHASHKFAALRNSLADESFLLLVFANYDRDADGFINPTEFSWLLIDLGVELDDRYTLKAFNSIDQNRDRYISFEEFSHWWSYGFVERGRKPADPSDDNDNDDGTYRRMDAHV